MLDLLSEQVVIFTGPFLHPSPRRRIAESADTNPRQTARFRSPRRSTTSSFSRDKDGVHHPRHGIARRSGRN
jgi:hypothetical protein